MSIYFSINLDKARVSYNLERRGYVKRFPDWIFSSYFEQKMHHSTEANASHLGNGKFWLIINHNISIIIYNVSLLPSLVGFIAFSHEIWNKAMVHRGCQTAGAGWGTTLVLLARPGGGCCRNEGCTSCTRSRYSGVCISISRDICKTRCASQLTQV